MTNSKLLVFIKALSKTEIRDLDYFLSCARGAKDVYKFFKYLKRYHPEYPDKYILKETIAKKIFKGEKNNVKKVENAMFRFTQLLDEFFISEELKASGIDQDFLYLKALQKRKLDKYFFKKAELIHNGWEKQDTVGIEHLHNKYRLIYLYYSHPKYAFEKDTPLGIDKFISSIDKYYFSLKLYWTLCLYNNNNYYSNSIADNELNKSLLKNIIELSRIDEFKQTPQIKLLSNLLNSFISADYGDLDAFKNDLINHLETYSQQEKNNILMFLNTIGYENHKRGKPNAIEDLFKLNCLAVDHNFLLVGGYITNNRFTNIVNIGFAAKKFDWTEKFINTYGIFLPKTEREDVITICAAKLDFHKGKYETAIQSLSVVKFHNALYGLHARSIQLKCYFELGETFQEQFYYLTGSFYLFVNRNDSFSDGLTQQVLKFISFSKKLHKAKYDPTFLGLVDLSEMLNKTNDVAYKSWLNEKLVEIKNSK